MTNIEARPDPRSWMNIDAGLRVGELRHHARDQRHAEQQQFVGDAIDRHGLDAWIAENDLVKTLRKQPSTAMIPIALLTGRREKEDVARGLASGADDYIVKPIEPDLFIDKINTLLKNRPPEFKPEIHFAGHRRRTRSCPGR